MNEQRRPFSKQSRGIWNILAAIGWITLILVLAIAGICIYSDYHAAMAP